MKKLIIVVVAAATMITGCAPSYVREDVKNLTDQQLCSRMGYAKLAGNMESFTTAFTELKTREQIHKLTISVEECKVFASMGVSDAERVARTNQEAAQAYQQQQTLNAITGSY